MDNRKTNQYYIAQMRKDLLFLIEHTKAITLETIDKDEVLLDSIMFRLIQISENSERLSDDFKKQNANIPWRAIKGMRNKIVHDYGDVDFSVVYNTIMNDIPALYEKLLKIC